MINLLDETLENLIKASPAVPDYQMLRNASVSFETPKNDNTPSVDTVNLFLFETKENRDLRDPAPLVELRNGLSVRRRAPLRLDCAYMVTAWSGEPTDTEKSAHQLLGQALRWLTRFPIIPETYLPVRVPPIPAIRPQPFPPPTMVAQMDGAKSAGEFWHALGIPPRPYFNLVVTIAMDLNQTIEDPIVTTLSSKYGAGQPTNSDERLIIGGRVLFPNGDPVPDAWVRLDPLNAMQITDASGRFIFQDVSRRGGLTLLARTSGYAQAQRAIEIPSITGDYDLKFVP